MRRQRAMETGGKNHPKVAETVTTLITTPAFFLFLLLLHPSSLLATADKAGVFFSGLRRGRSAFDLAPVKGEGGQGWRGRGGGESGHEEEGWRGR